MPIYLAGHDSEGIVPAEKLLSLTGDWKAYLKENPGHSGEEIEKHERTGRPLGDECSGNFLTILTVEKQAFG